MKTKKRIVEDRLRQHGYIDNGWCIDQRLTIRLGAIICSLKKEGMLFDDARSGYLPGTKNWRYYLAEWKPKPVGTIIETPDGPRYVIKV